MIDLLLEETQHILGDYIRLLEPPTSPALGTASARR